MPRKLFSSRVSRQFTQVLPRISGTLPSIAPNPSFNTKHIRQNPEIYSKDCLQRNNKPQSENPFKIVELYGECIQYQKSVRGALERSRAIALLLSKGGGHDGEGREKLRQEARDLKWQLQAHDSHVRQLLDEIGRLAEELPNLSRDETPKDGKPDKVLGYINKHPNPPSASHDRAWRHQVDISTEFDLVDFLGAVKTSGWGWYILKNEAVHVEYALVQYALQVAEQHGFSIIMPPSMVYSHIASACGFRPRDQKGEQQVYGIQQTKRDQEKDKASHCLAGTAEIPLAGMKANEVIDPADLPIRVVGPSRCYRAEAGARGVDTKGLYRVHEFTKVEMFAWTAQGGEKEVFDSMHAVQTEILQSLGLHCRILEMSSPELGASAARKIDIEAYFPSRHERNEGWGEVTSLSICTDYQTRRLNTRVRNPAGSQTKMGFPSTVNGTAMAVPRILAAILEYGWDEKEDCVRIAEVLWPWMNGIHVIKKKPIRESKSSNSRR